MSGVTAASRIVVKIGSSSLTREDGGLDLNRIDAVARLAPKAQVPLPLLPVATAPLLPRA